MGLAAELAVRPLGRAPWARGIRWFAGSRFGAWALSPTLRHLDQGMLWLTRNRMSISNGLAGTPTLFLTTTGARSGLARTAQLIAVPAGADLAVIGSNFGRAAQPGWVANLQADPRATASYRDRRVEVIARELTGDEASAVWQAGRELYRGFSTYPSMAPARTIRVFLLSPRESVLGG
jgi:deazaflavin-dependent oxidoreductase (nitroreductase family)